MSAAGCRFCSAPLERVLVDLGSSPLANSYLSEADLDRPEAFYPLCARVCEQCLLVQLPAATDSETIFSEYAYFSSFSDSWLQHARSYVERVSERFAIDRDSLVIEVASNDGYLLRNFVERGVPCLGIEPAANVAREAVGRGVPTLVRFLGSEVARAVCSGSLELEPGDGSEQLAAVLGRPADLVVANNVFAHVPDLHDFTAGLRALLAPSGVLTIEVPHLLRLIEEVQFDTIYHEHFSYYSVQTARRVLRHHGLEVFDVEELSSHGGSLRLFARRDDLPEAGLPSELRTTARVGELIGREHAEGLADLETYDAFGERVRRLKRELLRFLIDAAEDGKTVVGYGAPAKANTLLNYCGVRPDLLAFTVDRSPHKQGSYLPGTRVPIHAPEKIFEDKPDYVLILPWNLKDEIVSQMAEVRTWGGRFVVAVPRVEVIDEGGAR